MKVRNKKTEEPKTSWYITAWGDVYEYSQSQFAVEQKQAIGNYFSSLEEAELAVRKLKAWKRLKDNSLRFADLRFDYDELGGTIKFKTNLYGGITDDLDLLFGGEE